MKPEKHWLDMPVDEIVRACEQDEGQPLPGLREAIEDAKSGRFGAVHTPAQILAKSARIKSGKTQAEFAGLVHTPVSTLRDWEQGRRKPPGAVSCLFALLEKHPELFNELETA